MLIKVISLYEDCKGLVDAACLDQLIKNGTITAFKRSSGWVRIGQDPVRQNNCSTLCGPERRKIAQYSE